MGVTTQEDNAATIVNDDYRVVFSTADGSNVTREFCDVIENGNFITPEDLMEDSDDDVDGDEDEQSNPKDEPSDASEPAELVIKYQFSESNAELVTFASIPEEDGAVPLSAVLDAVKQDYGVDVSTATIRTWDESYGAFMRVRSTNLKLAKQQG